MTTKTKQFIQMAKYANYASRYKDMWHYVNSFISSNPQLSPQQLNLLKVAFSNLTTQFRSSLRSIISIERRQQCKGITKKLQLLRQYRKVIQKQLQQHLNQMLLLADKLLVYNYNKLADVVTYYKIKGDAYRYICEYAIAHQKQNMIDNAQKTYTMGIQLANKQLQTNDAARLSILLNYSIFIYQITLNQPKAVLIATTTFDQAIKNHQQFQPYMSKPTDAARTLQLIRDNITLWTTECGIR